MEISGLTETVKINHPFLTAIKRSAIYVPVPYLLKYNFLRGSSLDFGCGCGFGYDTDELKSQGYDITGYDIYYRPEYPTKKFDTIICITLYLQEQTKTEIEVVNLQKKINIERKEDRE